MSTLVEGRHPRKGKLISIPYELVEILDRECPKDEDGYREETYSQQIIRLIEKEKKK